MRCRNLDRGDKDPIVNYEITWCRHLSHQLQNLLLYILLKKTHAQKNPLQMWPGLKTWRNTTSLSFLSQTQITQRQMFYVVIKSIEWCDKLQTPFYYLGVSWQTHLNCFAILCKKKKKLSELDPVYQSFQQPNSFASFLYKLNYLYTNFSLA